MRSEIKEYQAVEEAAMNFVKSVAEGDSKYAKKLFIDEAVLFGRLNGVLKHGSIEQFYHNVDTTPATPSSMPVSTCLWWRKTWPWFGCRKKAGAAVSTSPMYC